MISHEEFKKFLNWPADAASPVLSLYLDRDFVWEQFSRQKGGRAFLSLIRALKKTIATEKRKDFEADCAQAWNFISGHKAEGGGWVIFADESKKFIWAKKLKIRVPSQVYWLEKPYILPLFEVFDEYERYGVILADRRRARVLTCVLGQVEEEKDALALNDVRHFKTSGKDNWRSAFKLQRTNEMHADWHLKHVAQLMQEMETRRDFHRLVLAGPQTAVDELYRWLSPQQQKKVVGRLLLPVNVEKNKLERALMELETQIERKKEEELVRQLVRPEARANYRALGLDAVLAALDRGRVRTLIYSENSRPRGSRCRGCGYLYSQSRMVCGRCGSSIDSVEYLLEEMARIVAKTGGKLEEVRGEAAQFLDKAGGIGAVLIEKDEEKKVTIKACPH